MKNNEKISPEKPNEWHKDPNNWIWGIFYYNKEDRRIFPPKRIEWMGWTINFANPKSILAFLILMAFFFFVIFLIESRR
jgi:uncharacterized membrane protein